MKKIMTIAIMTLFILTGFSAFSGSSSVPTHPTDPVDPGCGWNYPNCEPVDTEAIFKTTTGDYAPLIKCVWTYDEIVSIPIDECGEPCEPCYVGQTEWKHDACCCIDGLQVKPILGASTTVGFYAVVTDPDGLLDITNVWVNVWHPDGKHKYQVMLEPITTKQTALDYWDHAIMCHPDLITENTVWAAPFPTEGYTWQDDVRHELEQMLSDGAYLYRGTADLSYCQPAGWYTVRYGAQDHITQATPIEQQFWYIPTAALALDFTEVTYTGLEVLKKKTIGGNEIYLPGDGKRTVKNIGNTPIDLTVWQDDMEFGYSGGPYANPENVPLTSWNVMYEVQLSSINSWTTGQFWPYQKTSGYEGMLINNGFVPLCSEEKLDFSITPLKNDNPDGYQGTMQICAYIHGYTPGTPILYSTPEAYYGPLGDYTPLQ
jgi:hypothetical protein